MSDQVVIGVSIDTTEAEIDLADLKEKTDATVRQWRQQRQEMIGQMHDLDRGIGLLIRGIRLVAEATGTVLDPMQNALLGLVSSTVSIVISTSVALAVGSLGILTGIAIALSAFAYGMQIAQTARIIADFTALRSVLDNVQERLTGIEQGRIMAGMFGVVGP